MKVLNILKRVRLGQLFRLFVLALRYPLFLWPTYKATQECISLSDTHFGKAHHENGPANAFRHALWNYLIAYYCTDWSKNKERILTWTQIITDWHEHTFINREIAEAMDLHNNHIGRQLFKKHGSLNQSSIIELLLVMTEESQKINSIMQLKDHPESLVHLKTPYER